MNYNEVERTQGFKKSKCLEINGLIHKIIREESGAFAPHKNGFRVLPYECLGGIKVEVLLQGKTQPKARAAMKKAIE